MRDADGAPNAAAPALRRFAASLRRREALSSALGAVVRWGLLLSLPCVALAWVLPSLAGAAALVTAALLGLAGAAAAATAWRRSRDQLARWQAPDDAGVFRDELLTWLELDRAAPTATQRGMFRWLEREVHAGLRPHRRRTARDSTRLRIGRWRWLSLPLAMLLLAWLLSGWLEPPWRGAAGGGGAGGSRAAAGAGAVAVGAVEVSEAPSTAPPSERPAEPQEPPEPVGAAEDPDREDPAAEEAAEPPPLLDLPDDRRFVLPDFIGDGPTRRARMHVAELAQPASGGARSAAQRPRGGSDAGGDAPQAVPPTSPVEFERASEKALRSRHVPPAERAIVRRFFEVLRQRGNR